MKITNTNNLSYINNLNNKLINTDNQINKQYSIKKDENNKNSF